MIFSSLVARTLVPPSSLVNQIRRAIWSVDKDQPVWSITPLAALVEQSYGSTRFLASLLAGFSGVALLLAAIGIYGVMSYAVTERTHEIGIRMALGAQAADVRSLVVHQAARLGTAGLVIGLAGALAVTRVLDSLLFGVSASDPLTFAAVSAALVAVLLLAAYLPARRATRVDPIVALRAD